jgi:hypothetical protein
MHVRRGLSHRHHHGEHTVVPVRGGSPRVDCLWPPRWWAAQCKPYWTCTSAACRSSATDSAPLASSGTDQSQKFSGQGQRAAPHHHSEETITPTTFPPIPLAPYLALA